MSAPTARLSMGWRVCALTERGPSHEKTGRPNEDAVGAIAVDPTSYDVRAVAVSDGHGERAYFRSARGSVFAVRAALEASSFLSGRPSPGELDLSSWAADVLPGAILRRWSGLVSEDALVDPFSPAELERVRERARGGEQAQDTLRAYGATLMGLALAADRLICFQLGDGEIAAVSSEGVVRQPLPPDAQSFSNVTHSLCDQDPMKAWRCCVEDLGDKTDFILLASDGYSGAFEDRQAFLNTVGALAAVVREHGADKLPPTLDQSLRKAQQFTGDDASVAVVYRDRGLRA